MGVGPLLAACTSHSSVGGRPVHGHGWGVFSWALMGLGAGRSLYLWVVVIVWRYGALFMLLSVGAGLLFVGAGLLIVGSGACLCGLVVHGCWFVLHGPGCDMLSAVWSLLTRLDRKRVGVLTVNDNINNNNE